MTGLVDFFARLRTDPQAADALDTALTRAVLDPPEPAHRCGPWCEPYLGPIVQGRRDPQTLQPLEEVTLP